jgi:hypothetical protein
MTLSLPRALSTWGTDAFETTLKQELRDLDPWHLPLQQAMTQGSQVSERTIDPVILHSEARDGLLVVKVGIFYSSVIAGSCCADDPTPMCEENEYCEVKVTIRRADGEATIASW